MTVPLISIYTLGVPNRNNPGEPFAQNSDDWLAYQNVYIPEMNISIQFVNSQAVAAESSANVAGTAITSANFKGAWSNLTGAIPDPATDATTVFHNGLYYQALNAIVDVTLSEPGVTSDWALSAQTASRVIIIPPLSLEISGRYYILGTGTVTIPLPITLPDGTSFDFARSPGSLPDVFVGTNLVTTSLGLTDGIIMGLPQTEMIVISGLYEV